MPQPTSTPTTFGTMRSASGIENPTGAPAPQWASGITRMGSVNAGWFVSSRIWSRHDSPTRSSSSTRIRAVVYSPDSSIVIARQ